jgi:GT2 family glycosyltransferase/tetratricopeptide (TPR) repeat protein
MPFFKAAQKIVYFAHVPKCGGSAVEDYLLARFGAVSFLDKNFFAQPASLHWTRSSAQHISADALDRLFPADFFDASFAVVRHPVDRLVSEYHYLRDHLRRIDQSESFSTWVAHLDRAIAENPWLYDNHLRPMVDLIPAGATIFRLEDGLEQVIPYLDGLVGPCNRPLQIERVLTRNPSITKVVPSTEDIATIERLFQQDFVTFGYPMQAAPAHAALALAQPVAAPAPRPDLNAEAANFRVRGIACFKAGDITQAHVNFRFALNCAPEDTESHALIANTALRLGAPHLAADHAARALELQPGNLDAMVALAGARLRLKDPKARESVDALAPIEQLGDFRQLLRIALSANEGEYETALFDLATYLENHPRDVVVGELQAETFSAFRNTADEARFLEFIDGVGILADQTDRLPLDKPEPEPEACVDIIIPVYNAIDELETCLASIRRWPSTSMGKIILVDDCSSEETAAWLAGYRDRHGDVHLVRNAENLGFTRAVTAGVRESCAPFMMFLNSDTQVTAHWLDDMLEALRAGPQTALVGPLSNNGFHQTIIPTPSTGTAPLAKLDPDEIALQVKTISQKVFPRVPFLSGFCLLVDRSAFDLAGGLDCEAFPHGYWEVQDLCLKLVDLGFDSVIADHAYVHHDGGSSIGNERRERLTAEGLVRMQARHSALRVLLAEAVSATEPEVNRHRLVWTTSDRITQPAAPATPPNVLAEAGPQLGQRCIQEPLRSVASREVCLFVTHCPLGAPLEYTLTYLRELRRAGLLVIACLVVDDLSIPVDHRVMELTDGVLLRENGGYDFGAWADMLRRFPQVWGAKRLYFANDSIIGPFQSLGPIIDRIRDRDAGFFALSESTAPSYHAQSFFFGWNQMNLRSTYLKEFWENVVNLREKVDVVQNYELRIARLSANLIDRTQQVVFGFQQVLGCDPVDLSDVNPTHNGWRRLMAAGFPFVKTDLLRDGVRHIDCSDWEAICATHGADIEAMHRSIETSRVNRFAIGHVSSDLQQA